MNIHIILDKGSKHLTSVQVLSPDMFSASLKKKDGTEKKKAQ